MGNSADPNSPIVVFSQSTSNSGILCDGQMHTLIFQVKNNRLALTLDEEAEETFDFLDGFSFPTMNDMEIYIGGMKGN